MLLQEIIRRKRDGIALDAEEINYFIKGVSDWSVSDGQIAAFTMAMHVRGMARSETIALTQAMTQSGKIIDWSSAIQDVPLIDMRSVGGVGEKTPLLVAPMVAACGGYVPMISSRTLHHTGGTLDKLDSIPGYDSNAGLGRLKKTVLDAGCAIIGQTNELVPAIRRISAVLDITSTGESIPIITAAILAKPLSAGIDTLIVNVPVGSGSFMKDMNSARSLGSSLVTTAKGTGLACSAVITDMNQVLGKSAGNAVEILEVIDFLTGKHRDKRLYEATMALGTHMLFQSGLATDLNEGIKQLETVLSNGFAAETFGKMIVALGAPGNFIEKPEKHLPKANVIKNIYPTKSGTITAMNTRWIGLAIISLGGGRSKTGQRLDYSAGFTNICNIGDKVTPDTPIATVNAADETAAYYASEHFLGAVTISDDVIEEAPVIYETIEN